MTQTAVLGQLKSLTLLDRLAVIEDALRLIREELQVGQSLARPKRKNHLAAAAKALLPDYTAGGELTVFASLDSEDFHA